MARVPSCPVDAPPRRSYSVGKGVSPVLRYGTDDAVILNRGRQGERSLKYIRIRGKGDVRGYPFRISCLQKWYSFAVKEVRMRRGVWTTLPLLSLVWMGGWCEQG